MKRFIGDFAHVVTNSGQAFQGTLSKSFWLLSNNECKEKNENNSGLIGQVVSLFSNIVLDTPDDVGEVVWRIFSVMGLSSVLISCFLIWRHPELVSNILSPSEPSPLLSNRLDNSDDLKVKVMENISTFLHRNKPLKLALVGWPTATTGVVVWDTGAVDSWPVKLNGLYSLNLVPSVGPMTFKECWIGAFGPSPNWLVCPIHDDTKPWAFVITQWSKPPGNIEQRSLRHLTERLESLIY